MLPDGWNEVSRVLAIFMDAPGRFSELAPALQRLREALPSVAITLLLPAEVDRAGSEVPNSDDILDGWSNVWTGPFHTEDGLPISDMAAMIERIRKKAFDAAVIFTGAMQSPYVAGYCCYLADIPLRIGLSEEFGGGILTRRFTPPPDEVMGESRYLYLLEAAGLEQAAINRQLS